MLLLIPVEELLLLDPVLVEFLLLEFLLLELLFVELLLLEFLLLELLLLDPVLNEFFLLELLLVLEFEELFDFLLLFPPQAVADTAIAATIARISPFFKNPFFFLSFLSVVCIWFVLSFFG